MKSELVQLAQACGLGGNDQQQIVDDLLKQDREFFGTAYSGLEELLACLGSQLDASPNRSAD